MTERSPLVMLSAGEASGDLHAAHLFRELKKLIPNLRGIGMGGVRMREAGIELRCDSTHLAVIGLAEVAKHYGEIRRALRSMQQIACEEKPDLLICVDYKEFNFRLARKAKECGVKVLFYVSPQVWAWRPGRVKSYGRIVDHMAVIFPFEVPFYEAYKIPVTYVGHPLAGKVKPSMERSEAMAKFGFAGKRPVIGLLPGSRVNEINRLMPVILDAAGRLAHEFPGAQFALFRAPSISDELLHSHLALSDLPVRVIEGQDYDALQCCDAVITVSGTATLEVALLGIPMAIVYRLTPLSYWLGRLLVRIPYIGLPNILAGRHVVREFIQHDATSGNIAGEITRILRDHDYAEAMRQALRQIRDDLGDKNGALKLAQLAAEMLNLESKPKAASDQSVSQCMNNLV
ncbi:lipid-A-disaccharide synthase [Methylocaldum sp. RMAD-M]|uniref:lipid-A-disaccharide synthase n=1 Tax=Methylocaldum sp. RMAD-M TaxID=2806557 RepID=UPI000A329FF4|nr:lipid-A-disaccharide synthase [Methylocaldum sp. RMAD-M]MBP1151507.1 lipid-A-disaccharide synthase [Methylocaldum sp. RMAD-M]